MKRRILQSCLLLLFPTFLFAQHVILSEPVKDNPSELNFDVIGRMNNSILIFKNIRTKYHVGIYDMDMQLKEDVKLDFMPEKTFNVDFVAYPDFFYCIYQYQRMGTVHCMAVKMDAAGQKLTEPAELDTTKVGVFGDYKIYSTINSDDKKKLMIFKIQKKNQEYNLVTLLYDNDLHLIHKNRVVLDYNDHKDVFSDFFLDNEGNFVFTKSTRSGNRDYFISLDLVTKPSLGENLISRKINLNGTFIDEVKLKIDNINKRYLLNSFYLGERRGNVAGLYSAVWDVRGDSLYANIFTELSDSIRSAAKSDGPSRMAFNDFFIRNIVLKKDGSYLLIAEDYSSQASNTTWNRWDYLYNSPYNNDYYYYNPSYNSYYRPYNSINNRQNIRYYYDNLLVLSLDQKGNPGWSNVIHKKQMDDNDENYLSFGNMNTGGEIHFLFNNTQKNDRILLDNTITADGEVKRNPSIKVTDMDCDFMPRFGKQVGSRQVVMPCTCRGRVRFARIDF